MGYSGATWLVQEVCNALFDILFDILPRASELDAIEPTAARQRMSIAWNADAQASLETCLNNEPVLVRISAAKRLRDAAEREARSAQAPEVTRQHVETAARLAGAHA
jgi:chlorophyllide a reductase subunit Z